MNEINFDPKDRFVKAAQYARVRGLSSRHLMALRRRHPDAWPKEFLRANTTFFVRERDLDAFLAECSRREAAQPEPFADHGRKGGRKSAGGGL